MIKLIVVISMKKLFKCMIAISILTIVLTGCTSKKGKIEEISFSEFKNKMINKETFALYIGNKECSHCVSYLPTLKSVVSEYNITLYHLDNSKLSKNENSSFKDYVSITGTPTIVFITDGEEETTLNRIVGESSKEETIERFKTNGYIK